ncbi:PEGA domain-containing protein [Fibrobacterota bacterium]
MKNLLKTISFLLLMSALVPGLAEEEGAEANPGAEEQKETVKQEAQIEVPPRGQTGFIQVTTTPEKATVYLDGEELGLSPIEKKTFRSGRFDFTIMMGGEELVNERVNIWPNQLTLIEKDLVLPYGTIILTTKPGHTKVHIDGEEVGRTTGGPLTINNVTSGTHIVKVSARGRRSREVEVNVNGEDTTKINVSLGK